ncbi:MAG: GHMP kinase [Spirochaetia bacterium]|nr:GHMP kinase [Spirochaetia bacterium]
MLKRVSAFSPGHVTGLFYMQDTNEDPLYAGSLGAGFSLQKGVYTTIELKESESDCDIYVNDIQSAAPVSRKVIELFFKKIGEKPVPLNVIHTIETPQGAGFGTSGAGALSLSLALNRMYGEPMNFIDASKIAHIAEVCCRTGLGTVMGETIGGFKVLVKVGAPGIGETLSIPYTQDMYAVFVVFGPLSTKEYLSDPAIRAKIISAGQKYHGLIRQTPNIESFIRYSRAFTEATGINSPNVRASLDNFTSHEINASMLMFGEGTFSIVRRECLDNTVKIAEEFCRKYTNKPGLVFISKIAKRGAGIVSED